jgi:allantoinase
MTDLIIRSRRVVTASGVRPASLHITDGRIERIGDYDDVPKGESPIDEHGELTVMAGIVDSHVHVNEPGRTEWEGFQSATLAASAGGVTTLVDMPLNTIPPTTSVPALMEKVEAMAGKCRIDVGLWGGAVPGNASALSPMLHAGALGFKCFLIDSGVPEFGHLDASGLEEALRVLRPSGAPLLVHAELPGPIAEAARWLPDEPRSYERYLRSRPHAAEDEAIALVFESCERLEARAHIVHLSSAGGLAWLRRARDLSVALTAETTPHYLYFEAEEIPDGRPAFKCAPPIRERQNRERLWNGVRDGLISAIVSDHSPCTPELKHLAEGDVERAWGGIASVQFGLPVTWSAARGRDMDVARLSALMSAGPAALAGISDRKGRLASGLDGDIVVWDPDERFTVTRELIRHRHKVTPYLDEQLSGVVKTTYVRGRKVWDDGEPVGAPAGRWIRSRQRT